MRTGVVCLSQGTTLLAHWKLDPVRGHARDLSRSIREVLSETKTELSDIAAIGLNIGPGSFTGIRVAIATAKAIAFATNQKLITATAFELAARRYSDLRHDFRVIVEFQLGGWLVADFDRDAVFGHRCTTVRQVSAEGVNELLDSCKPFVGPGVKKLRRTLPHAPVLGDDDWEPRPVELAQITTKKFVQSQFTDACSVEPYYAAVSSAEQIWDARTPGVSE